LPQWVRGLAAQKIRTQILQPRVVSITAADKRTLCPDKPTQNNPFQS